MKKAFLFLGAIAVAAAAGGVTAWAVSGGRGGEVKYIEREVERTPALGTHFTSYQSDKYPDLTYAAENAVKAVVNIEAIQQVEMPQRRGYDPFLDAERAAAISPNLRFTDDLLDLCASCDYITIHVPATPKTKGMIGADEIAAMKEGAAFLNFSRDTLVDNDAMRAGLTSDKVRRYVTDFATPEVMTMEGALVLPHLGASTAEAEENCAEMAVREVMDYLETGKKVHCVN